MFKNIIRKSTFVRYIIIALRKWLPIPFETMFEYPCPFACYFFKKYIRNSYCLNKSNLPMSNFEYLRQLNLKRTQFRVKEIYSYEKDCDLVFRFCVKDLIFIYYVHEKSLYFGRFIMPSLSYIYTNSKVLKAKMCPRMHQIAPFFF